MLRSILKNIQDPGSFSFSSTIIFSFPPLTGQQKLGRLSSVTETSQHKLCLNNLSRRTRIKPHYSGWVNEDSARNQSDCSLQVAITLLSLPEFYIFRFPINHFLPRVPACLWLVAFSKQAFSLCVTSGSFASFQWWLGRQRWSHWRLWTWSKWRHYYQTAVSWGAGIWWLLPEAASGHQHPQPLVPRVLAAQISVSHSRASTRESQLPEELHW